MTNYLINDNKDSNGCNEVHTIDCVYGKRAVNTIALGSFDNAVKAVNYAKAIGYSNADGCYFCSKEAHKG